MSRIVFVNRFYWPEEPATAQLLTDLAEGLAQAGHVVHVITSHPGGTLPEAEQYAGVSICRLRTNRGRASSVLAKGAAYTGFIRGALRALAQELRPGDTLVMMTDPPLLGAFAAKLAERQGARLVHWLQDIYPEVAAAVGPTRLGLLLRPWRDRSWRAASACVAISDGMASYVQSRSVPSNQVHVIENWAPRGLNPANPADIAALRRDWGIADQFVVGYSGNLGRVHDLHPIIEVAAALKADPNIIFVFIGRGAQRATLERTAHRRGLSNVRFLDPQPRDRLAVSLSAADLHLVSAHPGCDRFVFPSKLYGIAAVGRPVLAITPPGSTLGHAVVQRGLGQVFAAEEIGQIAAAIQALAIRSRPSETGGLAPLAVPRVGFARALAAWSALLGHGSRLPRSPELRS